MLGHLRSTEIGKFTWDLDFLWPEMSGLQLSELERIGRVRYRRPARSSFIVRLWNARSVRRNRADSL